MATHASAEKRHRQSLKRRARNRFAKSTFRTAVKDAITLAQSGDAKAAKEATRTAIRLLDKAAVHGVLHKKTAQRQISRLDIRIAQLTAGK